MQPFRVRAFTFASLAVLLPSFDLRAQGNSAAATEAAVTDFTAAEAALAAAPRVVKSRTFGGATHTSLDGKQRAWVLWHSALITQNPDQPDAIEVVVEDIASGAKRSSRIESAQWNFHEGCGPVWTADGGVLVAYDVKGRETACDACVDIVRNGEAKPFLRLQQWSVRSVAASAAGTVAVACQHSWNGSSDVVVCSADGEIRAEIDTGKSRCVAAAPSPDGKQIALLLHDQVAVVAATGGKPHKLTALARADNDAVSMVDVPTWLADSKSFVVAAGCDVLLCDIDKGERHRWTRADLGGTAVDVIALPGDAVAGAIALHETDANLADVFMHAGCASRSLYLDLVWLDLRSGTSKPSSIKNKWVVNNWFDMPKVGDLAVSVWH